MNYGDLINEMRAQLGFQADFTHILVTMTLLLMRILPMLLLSPMFGGDTTPTEVKLGLGLIIALVMFPSVADRVQYIPIQPLPFIALVFKELFIGYCIAFIVSRVFEAATAGGQLIDNLAGTNQAQIMVPSIGQQVSIYASLQGQIFITLFLTLNGHHLVIAAIGDSLASIPLETFPRFSHGVWPFFDLMIRVFADLLKVALAISAPILLATFLTDLSLGMINRVAPQVQVFFVAMQIKPAVTAVVLLMAFHVILLRGRDEFAVMFGILRKAIWLLG